VPGSYRDLARMRSYSDCISAASCLMNVTNSCGGFGASESSMTEAYGHIEMDLVGDDGADSALSLRIAWSGFGWVLGASVCGSSDVI
jgi:hypothetical protein